MQRILAIVLGILLPAIGGAQIVPEIEGYSLEVGFSEDIERRLASINELEQRYEARFRERRTDARTFSRTGTQRFAGIETAGTEWAGERLIDSAADYTLDRLVRAMVAYNVNRAVPGFRGRIEIAIDTLQLSNPGLAWLESIRSYAEGRVRVTRADGTVLVDEEIEANLVVNPTVDRSYAGPALAFAETDPARRVGPTLARFVEKALVTAWPEYADEIVGPVVVRISDPGERTILDR